jgi:hypothetical protein
LQEAIQREQLITFASRFGINRTDAQRLSNKQIEDRIIQFARESRKKKIRRAIKILEQYKRLAEKFGIRLPPKRIQELDQLRDAGRISSSDIPAKLLEDFPGELAGLSLEDIKRLQE